MRAPVADTFHRTENAGKDLAIPADLYARFYNVPDPGDPHPIARMNHGQRRCFYARIGAHPFFKRGSIDFQDSTFITSFSSQTNFSHRVIS
jgi:hypothetical protein